MKNTIELDTAEAQAFARKQAAWAAVASAATAEEDARALAEYREANEAWLAAHAARFGNGGAF